jgi:hypothetical protein
MGSTRKDSRHSTERVIPSFGSMCIALLPLLVSVALIWPLGRGGTKVALTAGHEIAAHGSVTVTTDRRGNTQLEIKAESLAKPSSLNPPADMYVVWIQPPGENPKNEGELIINSNLDGQLKTEVPYKRFKLFITAEQNARPQSPTGPQVLSAEVAQS